MDEVSREPSESSASVARRQRRRELAIILAAGLSVVVFGYFETRLPQFSSGSSLFNNVVFFLLINFVMVLLGLMIFLVARNLAKLAFERRRRILGWRLRRRLVAAFLAVSIFPTVLLFLVAYGFMTSSIEHWFNSQVESSLNGSLAIAQAFYRHASDRTVANATQVAAQIEGRELLGQDRAKIEAYLAEKRSEYGLASLAVLSLDGGLVGRSIAPGVAQLADFSGVIKGALTGRDQSQVESLGEADMIRGVAPLYGRDGRIAGAVVADYFVPESVNRRGAEVARSFQEYRQLKIMKRPIKNAYLLTLVLITLLVLFSATWLGFYLAKGITVPIQMLAEGTRQVALGNWRYRIARDTRRKPEADDEIDTLVNSFNQMTADLEKINAELEQRRRYIEAVLANVSAGVVSLDARGFVSTVNKAAQALLGVDEEDCVGRHFSRVFEAEELAEVGRMIGTLAGTDADFPRGGLVRPRQEFRQLKLERNGRVLTVLLTATSILDEDGAGIGVVLFLDDVTEVLKVQRMEAWREVARRIAHEIKNPLTPIKLSAQRLYRHYAPVLKEDGQLFEECTRTIVKQVEDLKALVDEFSKFSRLPSRDHTPEDLNQLVEEAVVLFREAHPEIDFVFQPTAGLPRLPLDREGMKRVVINMLDNAVAACGSVPAPGPGGQGRHSIEVKTGLNTEHGIATLEVADTGCGLSPQVKSRMFEPYFSTKRGGTGLGLAIVSAIVAGHEGFIRVKENEPRGTRFVIELPVSKGGSALPRNVA